MPAEYAAGRVEPGELPSRSALLRAFRESGHDHSVLDIARELAECHERRHSAQSRAAAADIGREIHDIDGRRAELVGRIDRWVAANVSHRTGASLHTETLGSVIDRLAAKWIVAQRALTETPAETTTAADLSPDTADAPRSESEAHLHWTRLAELADGYQDLITDVVQQRRRLPIW